MGRQAVKITPDTSVLVRAITGDHEVQSKLARNELANADLVALALPALCELVWVLASPRSPEAESSEGVNRGLKQCPGPLSDGPVRPTRV